MERLEKLNADLEADVSQQLTSLRDVVTQKDSTISSVSCTYDHLTICIIFIPLCASSVVMLDRITCVRLCVCTHLCVCSVEVDGERVAAEAA